MATMTPGAVLGLAEDLISQHRSMLYREHHHGKVRRYLRGHHDLPYMPRGAKAEYRILARKSITNWLPLISDTFAKALWVDGYRPAQAADNAAGWAYWQANGLDSRQAIAHRGALEYGASYALVLPGDSGPSSARTPPRGPSSSTRTTTTSGPFTGSSSRAAS